MMHPLKQIAWYLATAMIILSFSSFADAQSIQKQSVAEDAKEVAKTILDAERVVFLGDSITYHGGFLVTLESIIRANDLDAPEILNLGLSSETCSGDSEPIHPFPRPNVNERLQRLLKKLSPDVLVVNYGMNDGIYHPFDKDRFENYKQGINQIIDSASTAKSEVKIILVTSPPFDPLPLKRKGKLVSKDASDFSWKEVYENYDSEVLAVYANWIMKQKSRVAACIDLRSPMLADIRRRQESDPDFRYAHDGVHVDEAGHLLIGTLLGKAMGMDTRLGLSGETLKLIKERQCLLRDSWLSEIGHLRPGVKAGMPIEEAAAKANRLNKKIEDLINENRNKE